jgi:hypothetical protein
LYHRRRLFSLHQLVGSSLPLSGILENIFPDISPLTPPLKMCYQKRLVYGLCHHSAPLGIAATCPKEKECEGARVHPLKTVRVEQMCPACREKKVKVDNNLTTIAEKIRRLREDLARRGFKGATSSTGSGSESGTASTAEHVDEDEKKLAGEQGFDADRSGREMGVSALHDESTVSAHEPAFPSASAPSSPTAASLKRNDMFIGGVCLSSTSLTTITGKRLL